MLKEVLKGIASFIDDIIENHDVEGAPIEIKHKRAALIFTKYDKKIRNPEIDEKLTDAQRARLQSAYESAAKTIKQVFEEVEKAPEEKADEPKVKFKVGQRVQFKTWEEMEKEFGLDGTDDIKCKGCFVGGMKPLCGTYATITRINESGYVALDEFSSDAEHEWTYHTDMIKGVKQ